MKERLQNRRQDDLETIDERMQAATDEIQHHREFDYLVVNDQFDVALQDLQHIVLAARLKTIVQVNKQSELLANLLDSQ